MSSLNSDRPCIQKSKSKIFLVGLAISLLSACSTLSKAPQPPSVSAMAIAQPKPIEYKQQTAPTAPDDAANAEYSSEKDVTSPATSRNKPSLPVPITDSPKALATNQPSDSGIMVVEGRLALTLNLPYQTAWTKIGKALPQAGYPIMEQDSTLGTYYIVDKIGTGGILRRDTPIYQLQLQKTETNKTSIILNTAQNQPAAANIAQRILSALNTH